MHISYVIKIIYIPKLMRYALLSMAYAEVLLRKSEAVAKAWGKQEASVPIEYPTEFDPTQRVWEMPPLGWFISQQIGDRNLDGTVVITRTEVILQGEMPKDVVVALEKLPAGHREEYFITVATEANSSYTAREVDEQTKKIREVYGFTPDRILFRGTYKEATEAEQRRQELPNSYFVLEPSLCNGVLLPSEEIGILPQRNAEQAKHAALLVPNLPRLITGAYKTDMRYVA